MHEEKLSASNKKKLIALLFCVLPFLFPPKEFEVYFTPIHSGIYSHSGQKMRVMFRHSNTWDFIFCVKVSYPHTQEIIHLVCTTCVMATRPFAHATVTGDYLMLVHYFDPKEVLKLLSFKRGFKSMSIQSRFLFPSTWTQVSSIKLLLLFINNSLDDFGIYWLKFFTSHRNQY